MHKLLERQLRRHFGDVSKVPAELRSLFEAIGAVYEGNDVDRALLERSLELTSQELTQRYNAINKQQRELEMILDSAPAMVWYKDAHNRVIRANRAAAATVGRRPEELAGTRAEELFPKEAAKQYLDDLEVMSTGQPKLGIIAPSPGPDGRERWLQTDKVPYRDEAGEIVGVIAFCVDITERKNVEDRLQQANKELEELVKFRTQFLNTTAHELRTPLTPIILQSYLLKEALGDRPNAQHVKGFEILERNLKRLDFLVRDVLDAARLQAGKMPMHQSPIDLCAIADECVESMQAQALHAGVSVEYRGEPPLIVNGDSGRLSQVMLNLLTNALKFTMRGGRVNVTVVQNGENALVAVQDTGIGIDPANIPKLFAPFSQVHDTLRTTTGGTGLGLYVSRGIVEEHGGTIWCYSAGPKTGSSFSFKIPLATRAEIDVAEQAALEAGRRSRPKPYGPQRQAERETDPEFEASTPQPSTHGGDAHEQAFSNLPAHEPA